MRQGRVTALEYDSKVVGAKRRLKVYTPPDYQKSERLPVLYLLHGIGGNEDEWLRGGSADRVLDELYAQKKLTTRMLVVLPNGRSSAEPQPANPFDGNPMVTFARFEQELLTDVIPFIEKNFATLPGRENRAIAGLSMGGGQSLNFGLAHPEMFGWVGGFSSAPNTKPPDGLADQAAKGNFLLLWVSCGDKDGLMNISLGVHRALEAKKVPHLWYVDAGAHDFNVWKNDLTVFAPRIFTKTPPPVPEAPGKLAGAAPTPPANPPAPNLPRSPQPGPTPLPTLAALPGLTDMAFCARTNVPHGTVEPVTYTNYAGKQKRLHVYLPPGYASATETRYPVLYLNHGGGDDDSKWSGKDGCAGDILDNLIAAGKARPMIIVMPDTRGLASFVPPKPGKDDACAQEYLKDILPLIDSKYRTEARREGRAIAGLSMGGFVVTNVGFTHLDTFGELYIYSSGYIGENQKLAEERFAKILTDPKINSLLRVPLYMGQGETDIALNNGQHFMSLLFKNNIRSFWVLSTGGHEWGNWRRYLWQTAQLMFPRA
ncbi:MAG: alpha/beta hydrolase-fold protein [Armatimonas sp.]